MPARLQHFHPVEWGCFTVYQADPDWQEAHAAWQRKRRQWLDDHGVDVLAELRAEMAAGRARQRASMPVVGERT